MILEGVATVFGWWVIDEHNIRINLFNQLHQLPVAVDDVVFDLVRCNFGEELPGAVDLALFNFA